MRSRGKGAQGAGHQPRLTVHVGSSPAPADARGVWQAWYHSRRGLPVLYAVTGDGRCIRRLEYGPGTGRTLDEANAELWRAIKTADPVVRLTLIRGAR